MCPRWGNNKDNYLKRLTRSSNDPPLQSCHFGCRVRAEMVDMMAGWLRFMWCYPEWTAIRNANFS